MPSRRDILKATGGLVLATGGSWLASHAHAATPNPPGLAPLPTGAVTSGMIKAFGAPIADADAKEIVDYLGRKYGQP